MRRPQIDQDVLTLSDFRANAAAFVEQVYNTKRPLVLTQRGRSAVVLLDVEEYENLLARVELLQDVATAEKQLSEGKALGHTSARKRAMERHKNLTL